MPEPERDSNIDPAVDAPFISSSCNPPCAAPMNVIDWIGTLRGNHVEHSRRDFLKASGLAAFGTTIVNGELKGQTVESSGEPAAAAKPDSTDLAALVNILQGTDSNYYFSRGNTLPIAAMPFGMAHWTLQSRSDTPWMFQPGDRRMQGFRCTHQLSPWLSDYGHAIFLPFSGETETRAGCALIVLPAGGGRASPVCAPPEPAALPG